MIDKIDGMITEKSSDIVYIACFFVDGELQEVYTSLKELPKTEREVINNATSYFHELYGQFKNAKMVLYRNDNPTESIFEVGIF